VGVDFGALVRFTQFWIWKDHCPDALLGGWLPAYVRFLPVLDPLSLLPHRININKHPVCSIFVER
jgi:hypothetical protein